MNARVVRLLWRWAARLGATFLEAVGVRRDDARDDPFFAEAVRRAFAEAPFCVRRAALMGAVRYYVKASDTMSGNREVPLGDSSTAVG